MGWRGCAVSGACAVLAVLLLDQTSVRRGAPVTPSRAASGTAEAGRSQHRAATPRSPQPGSPPPHRRQPPPPAPGPTTPSAPERRESPVSRDDQAKVPVPPTAEGQSFEYLGGENGDDGGRRDSAGGRGGQNGGGSDNDGRNDGGNHDGAERSDNGGRVGDDGAEGSDTGVGDDGAEGSDTGGRVGDDGSRVGDRGDDGGGGDGGSRAQGSDDGGRVGDDGSGGGDDGRAGDDGSQGGAGGDGGRIGGDSGRGGRDGSQGGGDGSRGDSGDRGGRGGDVRGNDGGGGGGGADGDRQVGDGKGEDSVQSGAEGAAERKDGGGDGAAAGVSSAAPSAGAAGSTAARPPATVEPDRMQPLRVGSVSAERVRRAAVHLGAPDVPSAHRLLRQMKALRGKGIRSVETSIELLELRVGIRKTTRDPRYLHHSNDEVDLPADGARPQKSRSGEPQPSAAEPPAGTPAPTSVAAEGERFLMISSLGVGFASGLRTMLLPFLALAAMSNRTAVLPRAQFGIPAFVSTRRDKTFLELDQFVDVAALRQRMGCLRTATLDEWFERTGGKVDALLQLGLPEEVGNRSAPGLAIADPFRQPYREDCLTDLQRATSKPPDTLTPPGAKKKIKMGMAGSRSQWDSAVRRLHLVDGIHLGAAACASYDTSKNARKLLGPISFTASKQTVMINNFPGVVMGPFVAGGSGVRGNLKLFTDVPRSDICGWPGFKTWPALSSSWTQEAEGIARSLLDESENFLCVQVRSEKLVIHATSKKLAAGGQMNKLRSDDEYLERCMQGVVQRVQARAQGRPVLLLTDMSTRHGSPSVARARMLDIWAGAALQRLTARLPDAKVFCGSPVHSLLRDHNSVLSEQLRAYPGNCANAEAAMCRRAKAVVRFGQGNMGDYVMGDHAAVTWYRDCEAVLADTPQESK